jgi:hypothetical protein
MASFKLTAGVLRNRWYQAKNPRKIAEVLLRRLKTPAKLKKICKKNKIKMLKLSLKYRNTRQNL